MYPLLDFSQWIIDEETPYGSGASEKYWLVNEESGVKGIFKFPKTTSDETITGEYWAEKLASEISEYLNVEVAKVDIGHYKNRIGSMSYMILTSDEELVEGIQYITKHFPDYDSDKFKDSSTGMIYSVQMVMSSLSELGDVRLRFISIPLFDCLIGNSDRHHSNWALIKNRKTGNVKFSPLYDNGSSLCCYVNPKKMNDILNDINRFQSIIYSKSKSLIGWENQKDIKHFDLYEKLLEHYFGECEKFVDQLINNLTDEKIHELVYNFDDVIMNELTKKMVVKFISERRNFMIEKYLAMKGGQ